MNINIDDMINEKYEIVKSRSTTYRELKVGLERVKKDIVYGSPKVAAYVEERFQNMLDEELNGLRIGQKRDKAERITKLILEGAEEYRAEIKKMRKEILELKEAAEETMQTLKRLTEFREISGEPHN